MEFSFDMQQQRLDIARLEGLITKRDPAAILDLDASGRALRLSTVLPVGDVLECLQGAGLAAESSQLRQLPSQCCGGCSG